MYGRFIVNTPIKVTKLMVGLSYISYLVRRDMKDDSTLSALKKS